MAMQAGSLIAVTSSSQMKVVEGSSRTGLGEQPIPRAGFVCAGEELQGDLPIEHQVIGKAHLTHAP